MTGRVVMASTLPAWKMNDPGCWGSWLTNAEAIRDSHDGPVDFLAVLELDARGREPFTPLLDRLADLDGHVWTFHLDDGAEKITSHNRLARICTGRNLAAHYAQDTGAGWLLYADADTAIPGDALPKLFAVDWPIVGGKVPTYCLSGPRVDGYDDFPVCEHMNTAGFLLVRRDMFTRLRWRIDLDAGMTDDPCYHADATELGYPTRVREDCVAAHWPPAVGPVEGRPHDLTVYR
jgi:hypothetical protein